MSWKQLLAAFKRLFVSEGLNADTSIKINSGLGCFAVFTALLVLLIPSGNQTGTGDYGVYYQLSIGLIVLSFWPLSKYLPSTKRYLLIISGLILCSVIFEYSYSVNQSFEMLRDPNRTEFMRISHIPGIFAMGMTYGFRLLYDFGFSGSERSNALKVSIVGFIIGLMADIYILSFMLHDIANFTNVT